MGVFVELKARGLIAQMTDEEKKEAALRLRGTTVE